MISGASRVPGPGRRPRAHAVATRAPTTSQTATPSGSPVRTRIAPMNTSSGPGPSPVQSVTATATAITSEPATEQPDRTDMRTARFDEVDASSAAIAPARVNTPLAVDAAIGVHRRRVGARVISEDRRHASSIGPPTAFSWPRHGAVRHTRRRPRSPPRNCVHVRYAERRSEDFSGWSGVVSRSDTGSSGSGGWVSVDQGSRWRRRASRARR